MERIRNAAALLFSMLAASPAASVAQSAGGAYVIAPVAIAGGGGTLASGAYELRGTLGQVATATLAGGTYRVSDGFWAPVAGLPPIDSIFENGFDP
jgi:hypothetical protein